MSTVTKTGVCLLSL